MAKSPKVKSTQTKAPKTNEKGEIISWDSSSADGKALRALFDGGLITNETAKQVKKSFPMFRNYANRTLNSALNNERKRVEKEVDTQKARGSSVLKSHSNLNINLGTINEDSSYNSAEDDDYNADDDDDVSQLSMDEFSFDTVTTAYRSEAYKAKKIATKSGEKAPKLLEKIHGNTKLGLPFLVDLWRDCCSHARISIQVQLLSGRDMYKKVFVRVSTDGKELVLTLPMSPYMSRSDLAFDTFLLAEQQNVPDTEKRYLKILLKHHPKAAARMVAVSKVKGRSNTSGFFYEQRIKLPRKVQHEFATVQSGDDLFTGKKFVEYPDGSVFLHVELVAEVKDNYIPEERMLDPKYMKSVPKMATNGDAMETEATDARVLSDHTDTNETQRAPKRTRANDPMVETVTEDDNDGNDGDGGDDGDDGEDDTSQVTGPHASSAAAAAAAAAEARAFAEAARNKAATVLGQVEGSSLQQAAAKGAAEGLEKAE